MDDNLKEVLLAAIGAMATLGAAYIAARWHISRNSKRSSDDIKSSSDPSDDSKLN